MAYVEEKISNKVFMQIICFNDLLNCVHVAEITLTLCDFPTVNRKSRMNFAKGFCLLNMCNKIYYKKCMLSMHNF